jgi:carbonic anhydrase
MQVEWGSLATPANLPSLPVSPSDKSIADTLKTSRGPANQSVKMQPVQFHFHSPSEHTFDGFEFLVHFECGEGKKDLACLHAGAVLGSKPLNHTLQSEHTKNVGLQAALSLEIRQTLCQQRNPTKP